MYYINVTSLEYPLTEWDIKNKFSNTSFPEPFKTPEGYALVQRSPMPDFDYRSQGVRETTPRLIGDQWTQTWELYELDDETRNAIYDAKCQEIKNRRTLLLMHSDWTQVADAPVDRNAWAEYRQQLRDISAQTGYPFDVVWPDSPSAINLPVQNLGVK